MANSRPLGVTIIAVLLIIAGLLELIFGGLTVAGTIAAGNVAAVHGHTVTRNVVDVLGGVLGGVSIVVGLLTLIFAWGLWALQRWAFWLVVIIEVISLLRHAFEFIHPQGPVIGIVAGMILPAVILIYFFVDGNVRAAFRI